MDTNTTVDLLSLLEEVTDAQSFLVFVRALRSDRIHEVEIHKRDAFGRGTLGWENHDIESFLGAAIAWAETSDFGKKQGLPQAHSWRLFAEFLYLGKIYE